MTTRNRAANDPIVLLVWIEAVAIACAAALDVTTVVLAPAAAAINRHLYPVTVCAAVVCATALFAIPHGPSRRYVAATVACVALLSVGWLPPDGLTIYILASILAARLTFAFGFGGAIVAWLVTCLALSLTVVSATIGPDHAGTSGAAQSLLSDVMFVLPNAILLGLIFGMIALMKIYATHSADAAATSERSRIALDLHDFLGHGLTTLRVQLQNAERYRAADPNKADDYVHRAVVASGALLSDVRETVASLHDDAQRNTPSLAVLFERLCADFAATHPVVLHQRFSGVREPSGRLSVVLYRTLAEALTNVARHASAANVWISVTGDERRIEAIVEDDGIGMSGEAPTGGHGLVSMRERVTGAGGEFSVGARAAGGTVVRAVVPVEAER